MVINVPLLEAFALCCEATRPRCFAFLAIGMFLAINGSLLKVEPAKAVNTMLAWAAGDLTESELALWIEKFMVKA
jgi:death-on-curing protein